VRPLLYRFDPDHHQSISSTRGVQLIQAFINNVNEYHHLPESFPDQKMDILAACPFRSTNLFGTNAVASSSKTTLDHGCLLPTAGHRLAKISLKCRRFKDVGRGKRTQEVFEKVVCGETRSRLGEIWLDGETVCNCKIVVLVL